MTNVLQALEAARAEVEEACGLLICARPANLERCAGVLERACFTLVGCKESWIGARGDPLILAEARRLHTAVRHASRLLHNAMGYYTHWNRILGALTGGYTSRGGPAEVVRPARLSLTG